MEDYLYLPISLTQFKKKEIEKRFGNQPFRVEPNVSLSLLTVLVPKVKRKNGSPL